MANAPAIERLLKRDRAVVLVALGAVAGLSSVYTVFGVGTGTPAADVALPTGDMLIGTPTWTPAYAVLTFLMWWIMMVAMMLPSAAPVLLLHAALQRRRRQASSPLSSTGAFLLGYLSIWAVFGLLAATLQWALQTAGLISAMLSVSNRVLGIGIVLAAAAYQFSPLKRVCLNQCRNPARFVAKSRGTGPAAALGLGARHGAYCVGCCGILMLLLFVGGIMNLFWIFGLGVYVLLEKLLPHGRWLSYAAGVALLGSSVALAVLHAALP